MSDRQPANHSFRSCIRLKTFRSDKLRRSDLPPDIQPDKPPTDAIRRNEKGRKTAEANWKIQRRRLFFPEVIFQPARSTIPGIADICQASKLAPDKCQSSFAKPSVDNDRKIPGGNIYKVHSVTTRIKLPCGSEQQSSAEKSNSQ